MKKISVTSSLTSIAIASVAFMNQGRQIQVNCDLLLSGCCGTCEAPSGGAPFESPSLFGTLSGAPFGTLSGAPFGTISGAPFGTLSGAPFETISGAPFGTLSGALFGTLSGASFGALSGAPVGALSVTRRWQWQGTDLQVGMSSD